MADLIFSQLEEIGSDQFADFKPYTPATCKSQAFDKQFESVSSAFQEPSAFCNFDFSFNYFGAKTSPLLDTYSPPVSEVKLRNLVIQDHNGKDVDATGITKVKLKLVPNFFGLEYEDLEVGRSLAQFYPHDIVTIVRQSDRIGIYIQFRRYLTSKRYSETMHSVFNGNDSPERFDKDSPFTKCMYLMLEFFRDPEVSLVFDYCCMTAVLNTTLKVIYPDWMLCNNVCTSADVHVITHTVDTAIPPHISKPTTVSFAHEGILQKHPIEEEDSENDDADNSADDDVKHITDKVKSLSFHIPSNPSPSSLSVSIKVANQHPTKHTHQIPRSNSLPNPSLQQQGIASAYVPQWGKSALAKKQQLAQAKKLPSTPPSKTRMHNISKPVVGVLNPKDITKVLPPSYNSIVDEVKYFAEQLLLQGALMPFQLTVELCKVLSIVSTQQAKVRAKSLLYKLAQHPNAQLTNIDGVAKYLTDGNMPRAIRTSASVPSKTVTDSDSSLKPVSLTSASFDPLVTQEVTVNGDSQQCQLQ